MAGKAGSGGGAIGLNSVTLVEKSLVVELLQKPPKSLDILIVVRDVGVLHIYPVAHTTTEVFPLLGKHHHVLAALVIIFLNGNRLADILLGNAKFLLYAEFYRQTVCIPTGFTMHLKSLHSLKATECVLNAARQYVVNTWMSVGRWRSLEEDERRATFALADAAMEKVFFRPFIQYFLINLSKVKMVMFWKLFCHIFC